MPCEFLLLKTEHWHFMVVSLEILCLPLTRVCWVGGSPCFWCFYGVSFLYVDMRCKLTGLSVCFALGMHRDLNFHNISGCLLWFFFIIIHLLSVPGLHWYIGFSLVVVSRGCALVVHRLLIAVASLVAEHGLKGVWPSVIAARGLSSCSSQALEHRLSSCGTCT